MKDFLANFESYKRYVGRVFKVSLKGHSEVCMGASLKCVGRTVE